MQNQLKTNKKASLVLISQSRSKNVFSADFVSSPVCLYLEHTVTVIQPRCQASSSPTRKCHSHKSQESSYFHYSIGRINQSPKLKGETKC